MLTAKQHELLRFIHERLEETGISPSFEEMKEALDLKSKSGVHRLISALEERGFIRRLPNRARALEVLKMPESAVAGSTPKAANDLGARTTSVPARMPEAANDVIDIPLHGRIAAGAPIEALEDHQSLPVPAALLGPGEHFALEVSGDSMIDAAICDGDYVVIRQEQTASNGQMVAALIGEEATVKTFQRKDGKVWLLPHNDAYEPIDGTHASILGVVTAVLRSV